MNIQSTVWKKQYIFLPRPSPYHSYVHKIAINWRIEEFGKYERIIQNNYIDYRTTGISDKKIMRKITTNMSVSLKESTSMNQYGLVFTITC